MFDLVTEKTDRPFKEPALVPRILSMFVHVGVLTLVIAIPLMTVTQALPDVPMIMAFVADSSAPPPPPPPPPPAPAPKAASKVATAQPTPSANAFAAPLEAPSEIRPELPGNANLSAGVVGGVEGGVVGGIVGGIVGNVVPPPPPPPPPPQAPVRTGGQIKTPALLHRVEPVYPDLAAAAHVTGMVILEAVVDPTGCVQSVKVLRSAHPLLDREAVTALKQWRYAPLLLNGIPAPFALTVTFNFSVARSS